MKRSVVSRFFISGLLSAALVICVAAALSSPAQADPCNGLGFYRYSVDDDGRGTCYTSPVDFYGGSGVANCTLAANGNINCTCKGTLIDQIPIDQGDGAIVGNEDDKCCVVGGLTDYYALQGNAPRGIATPSRRINATCRIRNHAQR